MTGEGMRNTVEIWRRMDELGWDCLAFSDRVWAMPELAYAEHCSCAEHASMLEKEGFRLTKEVAGTSTDVADVSRVVPTVQARGATYAIGTPGHSWQLTGQGMLPAAHKGMVHVAKVMAGTAVDAIDDPDFLARAKADLSARTARTHYQSPTPPGVQPPLGMSKGAA